MMGMNTLEILRKARVRLTPSTAFGPGMHAARFDILQVFIDETEVTDLADESYRCAVEELDKTIDLSQSTTHADILALLDCTIARLERSVNG